jgi:protein-tyrosine phosphatase
MPSVLFVCRANQFRSPLAAAFLLKQIRSDHRAEEWSVGSAGTWTKPGQPAASMAMRIANRLDLVGLNEHRTRQVSRELLDGYDLILTMETGQLEAIASEFYAVSDRAMLLSEVAEGTLYDIPDPVGLMNDPEEVATELQMLIEKGGEKILKLAETLHQASQIQREGDS